MEFNSAGHFHTAGQLWSLSFAMNVAAKTQHVGQAKKHSFGSAMLKRYHFGAAIALQSRGEPIGLLRVLDQSFVLVARQPGFGRSVIQQGVGWNCLQPLFYFFSQIRIERSVLREQ